MSDADNLLRALTSITLDARLNRPPGSREVLIASLLKPADWVVNPAAIRAQLGFGKNKIYPIFQYLIALGYCSRSHTRKPSGEMREFTYRMHRWPISPLPENRELVDSPLPENRETVAPLPENRELVAPLPQNREVVKSDEAPAAQGLEHDQPENHHFPVFGTVVLQNLKPAAAPPLRAHASNSEEPAMQDKIDIPVQQNQHPVNTQKAGQDSAIPGDWLPQRATLERMVMMNGIPGEFAIATLAEFIAYWEARGDQRSSWESLFIRNVIRQWDDPQRRQAYQDDTHGQQNRQPARQTAPTPTDNMLASAFAILPGDEDLGSYDPDALF